MFAVIMAGGAGTRFWPVSRNKRPKQFLNISSGEPMIVETCNRLGSLIQDNEIIIVLGQEHIKEAQALFQGRKIHILSEPVGRNTAPCIGLGAIYAQSLGCKEAAAFLPADHYVGAPSSFLNRLEQAGKLAASGGIVTLGIVPTRPETGYGYIKKGDMYVNGAGSPAYSVSAFKEKPDLETALKYLAEGKYLWNAGIFVATPETILNEIKHYIPNLYKGLERIKSTIGTPDFEKTLQSVYQSLGAISFDYGIMEKTQAPTFVLPCECGWSDVGSWESLYDLKSQNHDEASNLCDGEILLIDCHSNFISNKSKRLVACLGVDHCLVVDTQDALLIADIKRSQEIRRIVEALKKQQREELI